MAWCAVHGGGLRTRVGLCKARGVWRGAHTLDLPGPAHSREGSKVFWTAQARLLWTCNHLSAADGPLKFRKWILIAVGVVAVRQSAQAASAAPSTRAFMYRADGVCMCGIQLRACSSAAVSGRVLGSATRIFPGRDLVLAHRSASCGCGRLEMRLDRKYIGR
jgi:hypothetical protein